MTKYPKIACVIPARLKSSRFPKKILAPLQGKPLIQWVWEAASRCPLFDQVVLAIDAQETAEVIESFGGKYHMTAERCNSGTERIIELFQQKALEADIWVNWQGDEPFITSQMIRDLLQTASFPHADIWTLKKRIQDPLDASSSHTVKVVCDAQDFALYFSRSEIPYYREAISFTQKVLFKHIGIYAYTAKALEKIATFSPCYLEEAEYLEQLRFLYHGLRIQVHPTSQETIGIDHPEHLAQAEAFLLRSPNLL